MTIRGIPGHLSGLYGVAVSPDPISRWRRPAKLERFQAKEASPPVPCETSFSRVSSAAITKRRSGPRFKTRPVAVTRRLAFAPAAESSRSGRAHIRTRAGKPKKPLFGGKIDPVVAPFAAGDLAAVETEDFAQFVQVKTNNRHARRSRGYRGDWIGEALL